MKKVFKSSRWHYFLWYVFAFALLAFGSWLMDEGATAYGYVCYGAFVILAINFEIAVYNHRLILEDDHVTMIKGVMKLERTMIGYNEILDMGVHQTFLQRILGYGRIDIDTGGTAGIEISLPAIKSPMRIQEIIRRQINVMRGGRIRVGDRNLLK